MALIKCKECGAEVSSAAKACPKCAAPVPKGTGAGTVIKWIVVAFTGYVVYTCSSVMEKADRNSSQSTPASASSPVPADAPGPILEVQSWKCEKEHSYAHVRGEVKNLTDRPLENVLAVGTMRTTAGELVQSEDTLIDLRTLMPGQKSAFDVMIPDNPLGKSCELSFRTFRGQEIPSSFKKK